jgi:surfeit locus 1 family protein
MKILKSFFSRRWWWTTLLVLAAIGVMVRLGIWQIERHQQRAAFNTRVTAQLNSAPIVLTPDLLATDLTKMEYRQVSVTGTYDHSQQIALRNQVWRENNIGVHLLTPLVISGTHQAVLINRGWIPQNQAAPENWKTFDEPGVVTVTGNIRISQAAPDFGGVPDPEGALKLWNLVNLTRIAQQMPMPLLPVYIQQIPDPARLVAGSAAGAQTQMPFRAKPELDLSEGSHLGYASQWFIFALTLALGYPYFVCKQEVRN